VGGRGRHLLHRRAHDGRWRAGGAAENVRVGATLAIPIDLHNSVKLYGSYGAFARFGGNFTTLGAAWQFRWGGGL